MKKVCVFIEQVNGRPTSNSEKILFMALMLKEYYGYTIDVIVLDDNPDEFLTYIKSLLVDTIYYVKIGEKNKYFLTRENLYNLTFFLQKINPSIIWGCNSACYNTIFPKIAYILNAGSCAACIDFYYDEKYGRIDMIRTAYSNNIYAQISTFNSEILVATILDDSKKYALKKDNNCERIFDITSDIISSNSFNVAEDPLKIVYDMYPGASKIVIGLGNGISKKSDLLLFKKLATLLNNASIGGTRELVNRHIIPQSWQIGSTGTHISADIYIAFGISGSPQHIQGIERVNKIIAVNYDPFANIFQYSDYSIVGDLFEVADYMINYLERKDIR